MLKAISYKTKQLLLVLLKFGLVVAAFYFIYHKLFQSSTFNLDDLLHIVTTFSAISSFAVIFLLTLSVLNWYFEIMKWQTLVECVSKLTFNHAKAQTLAALTASLLTPNRIGDYGAKAMYYEPNLRKKIMFLNLIGNSAQMGITTILGVVGVVYFTLHFQPTLNYTGIFIWATAFIITISGLIWTFKANWFGKKRKAFNKLIHFINTISKKTILKTVLFYLLRYLIFSFQFYYLLSLFDVNLSYIDAMVAISTMYLLSSIIPSIFIFDVIIKGGVAVYVFGLLGVPEPIILSVVTFMWILNFVLPSMIGSYHVLQFKLPKTVS
jgi:uncharacterized membrane protein YbhN (UPF0104 family)